MPPYDGATIAMYNLAESLTLSGAEVKMLSFNTKKHFIDLSTIEAELLEKYKLETVYLDASVKISGAIKNLFCKNESYNIIRFDSDDFHHKLKTILQAQSFDIIQFEGLFLSPYLQTARKYSKAKMILRAHNVEWLIWIRLAGASTHPIKKKYLSFLASRLRQYEKNMVNQFDAIVALTPEDKKLLIDEGCTIPVEIAPVGLNTQRFDDVKPLAQAQQISVFHLGSMDWLPNIEAVNWFLKNVWPLIIAKTDCIQLYLAGKNMADEFFRIQMKNVFVEGEIKDARKFMSDKTVMIVPLLSGGGMRVKIVEGLAAGKVIVSTSIGAEGIACTHGENILIANTAEEFANTILSCLNNHVLLNKISANAQLLARNVYDNSQIGKHVAAFYNTL
ncbi:MAG: glycosyltransferase [Bacteroidetes bacterium CHB6]|nr:glycosyltransferase [Bacteroidetes bacterium CHB6]